MGLTKASISGLLLLLWGCSSVSHSPPSEDQVIGQGDGIQGYLFSGRLAIRQPAGTDSGKIEWLSRGTTQHVELFTPLGSTLALLDRTPQTLHLVLSDHSEYWATDAEQLTQSVLGYALPLEGMPWWVLGQAAPGPATVTRNSQGLLETLVQGGWRLDYRNWRQVGGQWLPGELLLEHDELTIRLKVDKWILELYSK